MTALFTRRSGRILAIAALALPLLVVPGSPNFAPQLAWSADATSASLATFALIFAIVALSFGTLMRLAGLPSVALGALFGVGAYTAAILTNDEAWTFIATLPLAILVPAVFAAAIGIPTFRTSGVAFLVITIGLSEFIVLILTNSRELTNGTFGLTVVGADVDLGPLDLSDPRDRYWVAVAFLYGAVIVTWWVVRSRLGKRLELIRDNEALARSIGIEPRLYKLAIFTITAALAGAAGQLYLYQQQAITPDLFGVYPFIPIILMAVLGGSGTIAGPIIGAYLVSYAPSWLSDFGLDDPTTQTLVYGVLLVVVMIVAPGGFTGVVMRGWSALGSKSRESAATVADDALPDDLLPEVPAPPAVPARALQPSEQTGERILHVDCLTRGFGAVRALDSVSLSVWSGEILGVIGPNGSGKTTLFNCISGFVSSDGGVVWSGRRVRTPTPQRLAQRGLVRTFQHQGVFASMSAREVCRRVLDLPRRSRHDSRVPAEADALIDFCGLSAVADRPVSAMSYGQVRVLGIALGLAARPRLFMLDEPAAGLNDHECCSLRELLESIRVAGVTLVVVDHDMTFLLPLCDRVVVLDAGRVVAEGDPRSVTRDPKVVAVYLGERFVEPLELAGEER